MSPLDWGESGSIERGFMLARLQRMNEDKGECFNGNFQIIYESKKEIDPAEILFIPAIIYNLLLVKPDDPLYLLFAPGTVGGFRLDERD